MLKKTTKKAPERHQNLSKDEKEKRWQHGRKHYKDLLEDEKQKLVEYRKKYYRIKNS